MNDLPKTLIYATVAGLLVVMAIFSAPGEVRLAVLEDTGTEFFPDFQNPERATELAVMDFNEDRSAAVPFNVRREANGVWTIPSHHGYPADGTTRMAKAAALVVGLQKASVRSIVRGDHKSFGVVDPLDEGLDLEGRGTRVTFRDQSGSVLADLIIGDEVPDRPGQHFVRLPRENTTYTAEVTPDLSTNFEDWIETDLLKVTTFDVTQVIFDNYSVDERQGVVMAGEKLDLANVDGAWQFDEITVAGEARALAEDEELDTDKMTTAVNSLADVKIVGVRPKPQGLTPDLQRMQGIDRMIIQQDLQGRGYFVSGDKLYSNEGDLLVKTAKGVLYTLKFGEIVFGSGDAVTAGTGGADPQQDPGQGDGSHRYLMVTAEFDESLLAKPEGTVLPEDHLELRNTARLEIQRIVDAVNSYKAQNEDALPASLADLTSGDAPLLASIPQDPWEGDFVYQTTEDGFVVRSLGEDRAPGGEGRSTDISSDAFEVEDELRDLSTAMTDYENEVVEGQAEAASLTARFGPWYYVIDGELFGKLHLGLTDLVKKKDS